MPRSLIALLLLAAPALGQDGPVPAKDAASKMTLPDGFKVTLFAGEPDVVQPIAMAFDDRGRLWVVECLSYPEWKTSNDRVLIFEDRDNDGHFDSKKVFLDRGSNLSGINLGHGGVWLCSTPNLVFVPDRDGDDRPDGPAEVLLDGWDLKAKHNVFNSLTWGPDGWLYGCNGIGSNSLVGKPGTQAKDRTPLNCSVWRYHPTRRTFEVVFNGTTNPWGLDFDQYGQIFITNCVIKHAWQGIPGANYERMFGQPFNPNLYELMKSQADHTHWNGSEAWSDIQRIGVSPTTDLAGGGHAHCGGMIYLGTNWPAAYRNNLFTCNIHGNRINRDRLEVKGSSYEIKHEKDFLFAHDSWFRGVALTYGPDGGVYVADWSDTGECHDYEDIHRENGRIYKITYGTPTAKPVDLAKFGRPTPDQPELLDFQRSPNQWLVRHARRRLAEESGFNLWEAVELHKMTKAPEVVDRLNALWTLHAIGITDSGPIHDPSEWVRSWAVRLRVDRDYLGMSYMARFVGDDFSTGGGGILGAARVRRETIEDFGALARSDPSPVVRMALASVLQRLPIGDRWDIAKALAAHGEDTNDPYLPLMLWYAVEPMVASDPGRALTLATSAKVPLVRRFIARRYAGMADLGDLVRAIASTDDPAVQSDLLAGTLQGLTGRTVAIPEGWSSAYGRLAGSPDPNVQVEARRLALILRDPATIAATRAEVADPNAPLTGRIAGIRGLAEIRDRDLAPILHKLLADRPVRRFAIRALASSDDPATPRLILGAYPALDPSEKADALATLAARPASALALLAAIEKGTVAKADVSPSTLQALAGIADPKVKAAVAKLWATIRPSPAEKRRAMARWKSELTQDVMGKADPSRGRAAFAKACATCHTLFDAGGKIGPELTGSQRTNLDYVLTHVVDPSAIVGSAFRVEVFETADGRVLSGIVKAEDANAIVVQTANDVVTIPRRDLENRRGTGQSLMPEGLLESLSKDEVRDLVGYLASPAQVPLPK